MELFDLEIPIRATGGQAVKAQFDELEAKAKITDARISKPSTVKVEGVAQATSQLTALGNVATETAAAVAKPSAVTIDGIPQAVAQLASIGTAATEAGRFTVDAINRQIAASMAGASASDVQRETVVALQQAETEYTAALKAGTLTAEQAITVERELASVRKALAAVPGSAGVTSPIPANLTTQVSSVSAAILSLQTRAAQLRSEFRANDISALQYSRSMAALNAEVKALAASEGLTATETRALNGLLVRTTTQARGFATQGLDVIRMSAIAAAPALLGVEGAAGTLGATMLGFATSGGVTLLVLGGIAAIVAAFKIFGAGADDAKKHNEDLIDTLKREAKQLDDTADAALRAAKANRDALAARLNETIRLRERVKEEVAKGNASPLELVVIDARVTQQRKDLAEADRLLGIAERDVTKDVEHSRAGQISAIVAHGQALADNIRLKGADAAATRNAIAYESLLTTIGNDQRRSIEEQNAALAAAGAIRAALNPKQQGHVAATEDETDALVKQTTALVSLAKLTGDTGGMSDQLRLRLVDLDNALKAGNLTIQQRVALLQAQQAATEELSRLTGASIPRQATFGRDTSIAPKPAALPTGFNEPKPTPAPGGGFGDLAGGAEGSALKGFDDFANGVQAKSKTRMGLLGAAIVDDAKVALAKVREGLAQSFAEGIGNSIADGIEAGFAKVFSSGSIGAGFKALIGSLLGGIGSAMVQFGKASLAAALFMAKIKAALASLNPAAAIAVSVAMIAVGTALQGAASKAFGDGGGVSASVASGTGSSATSAQVIAFPLGRNTATVGSTASAEKAGSLTPSSVIHLQPIVIGSGDPVAQRQIVDLVNNAQRRGYKVA